MSSGDVIADGRDGCGMGYLSRDSLFDVDEVA
jgi:hypothetical protein